MPHKRLPIGIQTFREIREGGYYYVDKTGFALRLIEEGKYYLPLLRLVWVTALSTTHKPSS